MFGFGNNLSATGENWIPRHTIIDYYCVLIDCWQNDLFEHLFDRGDSKSKRQ